MRETRSGEAAWTYCEKLDWLLGAKALFPGARYGRTTNNVVE
jgi:hypothetical protein